jgi:hypothetical protein
LDGRDAIAGDDRIAILEEIAVASVDHGDVTNREFVRGCVGSGDCGRLSYQCGTKKRTVIPAAQGSEDRGSGGQRCAEHTILS